MAQVKINGKHLTKQEIEALKELVAEAACNDGEVLVVDTVESPAQDVADPVVILLGTPATCADPELEENLKCAHKTGQRVIWVWPDGSTPTELPPAAANYCYSYVSWEAEKLAAVVADDDVTCFETATGEKVPPVPTERNLCVDDEESATVKKAKGK